MKARRLVEGLLFVLLILMLGSCGRNATQDECEPKARQTYNYNAHIEIDNDFVGYEDVVSINSEKLLNRVVVETSEEPFRIGMMVFNDGQPITYTIDKQEYSYYSFTVGKKSWVDISIDSASLLEGVSKLSVVLLTNEGYYPEFNRDDLKNYSMSMDYSINNTSGQGLSAVELSEPENVEHVSLTEYFQICKDSYVKNYPEMRKYDFSYEEQCLYDLVNNDLDMVFTQDFNLEESRSLSVYRYASQYPDSNKTMDIRITGKPGTYYITIFSDGQKYGGFNGMETIKINIAENEMVIVPVALPPVADLAYSNVFALAFRLDDSEPRVYDSAILTTYFTQSEIDFYFNQIQTFTNILYEEELVTNGSIQVLKPRMNFRFIMNQSVTSYYNDYLLVILIDGDPVEYFINGESYMSYDINCAYGKVDLNIELFSEPATRNENFMVDFLLVDRYVGNSFTSPQFDTTVANKVSVKCLVEGDEDGFSKEAEIDPIYTKLEINNLSEMSSGGILNAITVEGTYTLTATVSNLTNDEELNQFILINEKILRIDDEYECGAGTGNEWSFSLTIPKEYFHEGMNEIHLISTRKKDNISYSVVRLVYDTHELNGKQVTFEEDTLVLFGREDALYTSMYVNSGAAGNSQFVAMFKSITTRNLCSKEGDTSILKTDIGSVEKDKRFIIKIIISSVNYRSKEYHFVQQQYIEGTY